MRVRAEYDRADFKSAERCAEAAADSVVASLPKWFDAAPAETSAQYVRGGGAERAGPTQLGRDVALEE